MHCQIFRLIQRFLSEFSIERSGGHRVAELVQHEEEDLAVDRVVLGHEDPQGMAAGEIAVEDGGEPGRVGLRHMAVTQHLQGKRPNRSI